MIGTCLAIIWVRSSRANSRREPYPSLLIDEWVMDAGVAIADWFVTPIRRSSSRKVRIGSGLRIPVRMLYLRCLVRDRIQHGHHVGALLGRSVDQAVGIDARVALIG